MVINMPTRRDTQPSSARLAGNTVDVDVLDDLAVVRLHAHAAAWVGPQEGGDILKFGEPLGLFVLTGRGGAIERAELYVKARRLISFAFRNNGYAV